MRILAIDTSSPVSALALLDGERVLVHDDLLTEQRHAEVLLPRIERALQGAGILLRDVELLAVGIGPGSFTGLRVGLATAKGLALATGIPLCGVSSLRVLARRALEGREVAVVVLDAGKGEVFAAAYHRQGTELVALLEPSRAEPLQLARDLSVNSSLPGWPSADAAWCGSGARRYAQSMAPLLGFSPALLDPSCDVPNGVYVAREAALAFRAEGASNVATLEPIYLRGSDAKLPDEPLAL
jgi:tRNA threonylcarbamoyladenosine biosynthesis protein TsaB